MVSRVTRTLVYAKNFGFDPAGEEIRRANANVSVALHRDAGRGLSLGTRKVERLSPTVMSA